MLDLYRRAPRSSQAVLLVGVAFLVGGCASRLARLPVRAFDAVVPRTGRMYAVLINGGGRPSSNYQSHLRHVKTVV
ncbi:MAG: hypothetical protein ACE5I7_20355, partial [Candidatus Binatia bacterium]